MDNTIGTVLDSRYEIKELIGSGGMANVYQALDREENRIVAVKILREEFARNEEFVRRFKNESKAIALLSHENIVKIYDVGFTDSIQYIVMEYLSGITLKDYINQQKVVDWKEACYFTLQILKGLQHAHSKGIVHRDIKPHNIMLLQDGAIKITDFGIARFARSEAATMTDHAIGSVHYISPEQARGENTDARTDIYSVGVMLFEMLTGQLPFEADTPVSVALKQIQNEPDKLCTLNPDIPKGLEDITMRAMQKNARMRYESAQAMLEELERFLQDPEHFVPKQPEGDSEVKNARKEPAKGKKKGQPVRRPLPVIPILTGIAAAFVLATVLFIVGMLRINNPFQSPDDVRVPNLIGLTYESVKENETYLENFNIQVEETSFQEGVEEGAIYHQEPKEGRVVKKGSIITIKVSGGTQSMSVEDYSGQDSAAVYARLEELGLKYEEQQVNHPSIGAGKVVKTDPPVGGTINAGETIVVYVSMGSTTKQVEVPDVKGLTVEEAKEKLGEAGLKIGDRETVTDAKEAKGKIIEQSPESGSMIEDGGRVDLKVSGNDSVRKVAVSVPLPKENNSQVTVQAFMDGEKIEEETLTPSKAKSWRVIFEGEGTANIEIRINSVVYKRYLLDFDAATHTEIN